MKKNINTGLMFILMYLLSNCNSPSQMKTYPASHAYIQYSGLSEKSGNEMILIGSASSAIFNFRGDSCVIFITNDNSNDEYNYFSLEVNGRDEGRKKIKGNSIVEFPLKIVNSETINQIRVFKSTEASNGSIKITGIKCQNLENPRESKKMSIEFIGNSITSGMGNDTQTIPCHSELWYDQHNAYWAYGPIVSRELEVNFLLSSVSGIGVYRNWNSPGPTMPQVYENLYLDLNKPKKRDYSVFTPHIVSICLGTNDLSDGDGINHREPFDQNKFTENYIDFVHKVLSHYPETQIALLTSPMLDSAKHTILLDCLHRVENHFARQNYKPFAIFEFKSITPGGCDFHPDIDDHIQMAEQLYPFYKSLLSKQRP